MGSSRSWRFLFPFGSGVWFGFIRKAGKVVHTGVQRQSDPLALFKSIVAFAAFDLGIVTLVDAGEHLHLHLCQALAFSQFF